MTFDLQTLGKLSLGFIVGISVGLCLRYVLFKFFLFLAISATALLALDYMGVFSIDWIFLGERWDEFLFFLSPLVFSA